MNQINSIILEGVVKNVINDTIISIGVTRKYKNENGEWQYHVSHFDCSNVRYPNIQVGDQVRIVGRLHQEYSHGQSVIRVIAEHTEMRRSRNKNELHEDSQI